MSEPLHAWVKRTITSKDPKCTITKLETSAFEIEGFVHYIEKSAFDKLEVELKAARDIEEL